MRKREIKLRLERQAFANPSWTISSSSIATSLPVALKVGPGHFVGQPSRKFQGSFS
jgi:hypothetical protein